MSRTPSPGFSLLMDERDGCQRKESDTILDLDTIACDLYFVSPS